MRTTTSSRMTPAIKRYLASIGRRGGQSGAGASKARTSSQARAAALARWERVRTERAKQDGKT